MHIRRGCTSRFCAEPVGKPFAKGRVRASRRRRGPRTAYPPTRTGVCRTAGTGRGRIRTSRYSGGPVRRIAYPATRSGVGLLWRGRLQNHGYATPPSVVPPWRAHPLPVPKTMPMCVAMRWTVRLQNVRPRDADERRGCALGLSAKRS
jgi:hypothetical protein